MKKIEKLEKLAADGDVESMFQLGVAYAFGRGAKLNREKALHWLKKAADGGHSVAMQVFNKIERKEQAKFWWFFLMIPITFCSTAIFFGKELIFLGVCSSIMCLYFACKWWVKLG